MVTKFKINSSKTKDCRVLKRQSLNLMKIGHQGAVLQERTPNFELDRALRVFNMATKFKINPSKIKDCRALTRQSLKFDEKWPSGGSFASENPQF